MGSQRVGHDWATELHSRWFGVPQWLSGKESACQRRRLGFDPWDSPGEGNGTPLQYSCLQNPMDRGAWQVTVHGVPESRTQLATEHTRTHTRAHTHAHTQLIYNAVLVSGLQQSDSVINIHIHILFHILFHYGLSQDIEYSFLCYTAGPCCTRTYNPDNKQTHRLQKLACSPL